MEKCGRCNQNTLVNVYRTDVFHTGWGCVSCGTAEEKTLTCIKCRKNEEGFIGTSQFASSANDFICQICSESDSTGVSRKIVSRLNDGRESDIAELDQKLKTARGHKREEIKQSIQAIRSESGAVRDMRQSLVQEMRNGNAENVRDINEYVKANSKYQ